MPHMDKRSGELVLRIVYDGMPEAGKTTTLQQLTSHISVQRRSSLKSPGSSDRRTEFFDWVDFAGGFLDGCRVRCQLVSVPGQPQLLHRRRYLLESADAIVFVADSRVPCTDENRRNLETTRRILDKVSAGVPAGVVIQANKQDLQGALTPTEVRRTLAVDTHVAVVGSVGTTGDGVMQAFFLAVRLASDRVRALLTGDTLGELPLEFTTAESLHAVMQQLEAPQEDTEPSLSEVNDAVDPVPEAEQAAPDVATRVPPPAVMQPAPASQPTTLEARSNIQCDAMLFNGVDIYAGHVWPPVKGRAVLGAMDLTCTSVPRYVLPWAPQRAFEMRVGSEWIVHTCARWVFDTELEARAHLMRLVKWLAVRQDLIPPSRLMFLSKETAGWRVWMSTGVVRSLREAAVEASRAKDAAELQRLKTQTEQLLRELQALDGSDAATVPGGLDGLGLTRDRVVLCSLDEGSGGLARANPLEELAGIGTRSPPLSAAPSL